MRLLLILLLSQLAWAQTVKYERTTVQIPLKAGAAKAEGKTSLAVQGSTVLLGDDKSNGVYRLPDLLPAHAALPPGEARLGANGTQVAIYRQGAVELYLQGKRARSWKQPEPLWFGEVGGQWVVVSRRFVEIGPPQARRRIPLQLDKDAQVFGVWLENQVLHMSTTDSSGSIYLSLRLKDGKMLEPETVRGDLSIRRVSARFEILGEYIHPGDSYTHLSDRSGHSLLSTNDYFPTSLSDGGGRAVYLLELKNGDRLDAKDLLEVLDPKENLRWTWEGPAASAAGLSGDGKMLVVLAAGKVYLQQL